MDANISTGFDSAPAMSEVLANPIKPSFVENFRCINANPYITCCAKRSMGKHTIKLQL